MPQYTDEFRANALLELASNHNDFKETSQNTGVSEKQLRRWSSSTTHQASIVVNRQLSDMLEGAIQTLIERMPERFDGHSWNEAVGVLVDKLLLLRGQATTRTESVMRSLGDMSDDERTAIIEEAEGILMRAASKSEN